MYQRKPLNPPQHIYPVDTWRIVEKQFHPRFMAQTESIFSVSNGYLGIRGCFEEGEPFYENCTLINGFYETWPICYGEEAHGFPEEGQTIVNVTDAKIIRLTVDDEPFLLSAARLIKFERVLDFKTGILEREIVWEMHSGKHIAIRSRRLVSYEYRHLAAISYEVTVLNAKAAVVISSEMQYHPNPPTVEQDPRMQQNLGRILLPQIHRCEANRLILGHQTKRSQLSLICAIDHLVETDCRFSSKSESFEDGGHFVLTCEAQSEHPIKLTKFMTYQTSEQLSFRKLLGLAEQTLDRAVTHGFEKLLCGQQQYLEDFWYRSDVRIDGDPGRDNRAAEFQQALRFNLFQIFQATVQVGDGGVPAKGLTGQAYDGNYFWDTEIYLLPFLTYTAPRIARNLLALRYRMLDQARERAREINEQGAHFPWRTINGKEASAYYAAGTAQYHIDADIIYALMKYVEITDDKEFLWHEGAEMLVETARMWYGLGFFSRSRADRFCLHGLTGPDEYTTVVDNNLYTNLMAQNNLRFAVETVNFLKTEKPERFKVLAEKTALDYGAIEQWQRAAEQMYVPFDAELRINPQDDTFLQKEVWDFENTPPENFPLLLHYHPLTIYRHQVIKQADVVLAMFLRDEVFSPELKRRNFNYYDPLTTGDSSLSVCIESIIAAELGYLEKALDYAHYAVLMDLEDVGGNVKDGCHIASMGGSWMVCVYGLAGMRDHHGHLTFDPRLPLDFQRLHFPLTIQNNILEVTIEQNSANYLLREGPGLTIELQGRQIKLTRGNPVTIACHR